VRGVEPALLGPARLGLRAPCVWTDRDRSLPKKIGVFRSSSLKVVPISPNVWHLRGFVFAGERCLGFGRIAASEIEAPNILAIPI
jgi:hypothetical protein